MTNRQALPAQSAPNVPAALSPSGEKRPSVSTVLDLGFRPWKAIRRTLLRDPAKRLIHGAFRADRCDDAGRAVWLLDNLPSQAALAAVLDLVEEAGSEPFSRAKLAQFVGAVLAAKSVPQTQAGERTAALSWFLAEEAEQRRWLPAAIRAGLYETTWRKSFPPDIADIIPHVVSASRIFEDAPRHLEFLAETRRQLAFVAIDAGLRSQDELIASGDTYPSTSTTSGGDEWAF